MHAPTMMHTNNDGRVFQDEFVQDEDEIVQDEFDAHGATDDLVEYPAEDPVEYPAEYTMVDSTEDLTVQDKYATSVGTGYA